MQRFNGKNIHNNSVTVDFQTKDVKFTPVHKRTGEDHLLEYWINLAGSMYVPVVKLVAIFIIVFGALNGLSPTEITSEERTKMLWFFFLTIVISMIASLIIAAQVFIKRWREESFPKFNYTILSITKVGSHKREKYNAQQIGKELKIYFSNIKMEYKAEGDVAEKLDKIEITPITMHDTGEWMCKITLKEEAKDGTLELDYL